MRDCLAEAEAIFRAGLARVDPLAMMERVLSLTGDVLRVATETECHQYDLAGVKRIFVLGAGKASARMALGLERLLGDRITAGVVAVKEGYRERLSRVRLLEASHPVPDARGVAAAREVLAMARQAGPDDLVIVLVSGGGSAILAAPVDLPGRRLTLADKQETTRVLLASGATIQEINCVRKKLSAVKGGRLAAAISPARCLGLLLSDVVGDDLDVIASGPTVADPTTGADALAVLARYGVTDKVAPEALAVLDDVAAGRAPDTPKPGDPVFARTRTVLVGTNFQALLAARDKAREFGYDTVVLTSHLTGEAREMANLFLGMARDIAEYGVPLSRPACVIAGGETTVTLRGPGKGGRNQEMALAFLAGLARQAKSAEEAVFLAASTDGSDGPTDATGAFASLDILRRGLELGLDPALYLVENDAYHYFEAVGRLLKTGPTNTNVCDIKVLLTP
ncbi:Hydroxypyruvate reductase [Solidesulfovibrio carbinoliphilus subsp. oakridgensis]|uniref:Hydroxypyruvate reductase n=1 Tax=Solidesulfovibrio carbinoliphilus subsp. oakridgensis TaxID=694327 RepID=G7QDB7_9BACT|nr:glycerate kinase [Solidesulfovibrio carbinoliphilus]EHJ46423.1 Hydroxypyruvate reductase [Solidesulfovibrio carbinoliphilus subsp. oakridgensis]